MCNRNKLSKNYELVAPDGGWGYMIAIALVIIMLMGIYQALMFGILFGPFLASIGYEEVGTSTVTSIGHTISLLAGLPANVLLQKMSYRKVAMLGSLLYVVGGFAVIFVTSTWQLIWTHGIIQGVGWTLMSTSAYTTFNDYFVLRRDFIMNCSQTLLTLIITISPVLSKLSMETYGFRGTAAILAAGSLHVIFAALCLHPVKWHMKILRLSTTEDVTNIEERQNIGTATFEIEEEALLDKYKRSKLESGTYIKPNDSNTILEANIKEKSKFYKQCYAVYKTLDLELFKDPVYINVTIGISLTLISDVLFISYAPLLLNHAGIDQNDVTVILTIHFVFDAVGKIILCALTAFIKFTNRYLQLSGIAIMAVFRLALLFDNSFGWIVAVYAVLGLGRGLVQNTLSLVFAELYPQRYITSSTLYMVVNAIVSTIFGQILGIIMTNSQNKDLILYALAIAPGCCAITWSIELMCKGAKK